MGMTDIYRVRKAVKQAILDQAEMPGEKGIWYRAGLQRALVIIDEEIDGEAEAKFLLPIKPSGLDVMDVAVSL